MSLTKCPKCGRDISEKAFSCVHCGFIVDNIQKETVEEELKDFR